MDLCAAPGSWSQVRGVPRLLPATSAAAAAALHPFRGRSQTLLTRHSLLFLYGLPALWPTTVGYRHGFHGLLSDSMLGLWANPLGSGPSPIHMCLAPLIITVPLL